MQNSNDIVRGTLKCFPWECLNRHVLFQEVDPTPHQKYRIGCRGSSRRLCLLQLETESVLLGKRCNQANLSARISNLSSWQIDLFEKGKCQLCPLGLCRQGKQFVFDRTVVRW